jgi:signal transduction histidine kinase/CHASE2 domain-containing sensor protein
MKALLRAVAASAIVAIAVLLLSWTTFFDALNLAGYDFALRLAGPISPTSPTTIVAIDENSLEREGAWPWPRHKLADLINGVQKGRPRAIAVDLVLDDKRSDDEDAALSTAIANAPSIVLAARLDDDDTQTNRWRFPNPRFLHGHVRLGNVHADQDFDAINRRIYTAKFDRNGRVVLAFSLEALRGAELPIKADFKQAFDTADAVRVESFNIRYVGDNNSFPRVPAWQVLDGSADLHRFQDQIVLIGSTAEGLGDQWFTPFAESGRRMSGVEIHANAIETLFAGREIREASDYAVLAALFLIALFLCWMDRRFEGRGFYAGAILTGPAVLAVSWFLMKYANFWLPFPPFWAAMVILIPGLEVRKLVRVNRDLDQKIDRLSTGWLSALRSYEPEDAMSAARQSRLFGTNRRNSRWKLDAVDFFNEELMRFLSFNNAVLSSIEDVIIVSDTTGRVVYQNPSTRRLEGYREDPGAASDYLASLLDSRALDFDLAKVMGEEKPVTRNFVPARNARSFYNVSLSPIPGAGLVLSLHDATAQYELNQAKSDMVSLVSHELRTPLTSIRGYSDMLLKYNLVQESGREFLGTIIDESNRLNGLIQSFLNIAYIESGRQKVSKTEFEIGPVLKDMFSIVGPVAAQKEISLEGPAPLNGMRISADRLLLYQALTNLVTNAIKYSPPGTTVTVGVANGNGRVRFDVTDQGCGIPPEEVSKIFEKFYRRTNRETREQSGFGLGLAFVKEVAARHGGDVVVESEVGKGSVFTLWIPSGV